MDKRMFLKSMGGLTLGISPAFNWLADLAQSVASRSNDDISMDENFWRLIRADYHLTPEYINLENGYYNIIPQSTLQAYIDHIKEINYQGSHYMRTDQWDNKDRMATMLAEIVHCDSDELIITRNTTESLDTVISGYNWKQDDQAVMAEQDYGAMLNQFKLMGDRYGVVSKVINVPNHPSSDEEIVKCYEDAITDQTRLLMVCHMINITGQILPIRKICDMAHRHGVDVLVDGAHAVGHIKVDMKELDCDYYGTSLHKWMSVPLGAGFLFAKKTKIEQLYPIYAEYGVEKNSIKKLNHTGTHPVHTDLAVQNAIQYYNLIGADLKEKRMRYIQNYWTDQVRDIKGINLYTPVERHRSCGIANVGIEGLHPNEMAEQLLKNHGVWTVGINGAGVFGCRITPNVYTTVEELDHFVGALKKLAKA